MKSAMGYKQVLILGVMVLVVACTKKSAYEYELKEHVHEKSVIDTEAEYLYVPSLLNSSRTSSAARPYWLGEQKRVKFQFNEKSLQIIEVEPDARFKDNAANNKLVMEVPISHLEYRCAQDKYKECTNREEENHDLVWSQRSKFKPDFEHVSITEANILPIEMEKLFGGSCYQQVASKFAGYQIEANAVNFEIEKTFKVDINCMQRVDSLSDLTVTAVYHYSFAKISSIASKEYPVISYNQTDQREFGFFTTETSKLDVDHNATVNSDKTFLNRWNPAREKVIYYLSKEFNKPENKILKDATLKGFEKLNAGLEKSGVKFRLELQDGEGRNPGDIRNNFIVMIEDPIDSGLLGYGPTVVNPTTGEILSGRTVMYPGVMKQFIKYTYDDIVSAQKKAAQSIENSTSDAEYKLSLDLQAALENLKPKKAQTPKASNGAATGDSSTTSGDSEATAGSTPSSGSEAGSSSSSGSDTGNTSVSSGGAAPEASPLATPVVQSEPSTAKKSKLSLVDKSDRSFVELKEELFGKKMAKELKLNPKDRIGLMSKYCTYPAELFNFDQAISNSLKLSIGSELKPWDELTEDEKQKTIDVILPTIWIPTLVHEMGHNLGLRHNFKGSEDKENFYSKEELHEHGVDFEIPYSSVMDYAYSDLNSLPDLGKYDLAALRFGYLREVADQSGNLLKVESSIEDLTKKDANIKLKQFGFCTDENVEVNVGCKRFDEGTTLTEMAEHQIKSYEESYKRRNFRNSRKNFSLMSDGAVADRLLDLMAYLRFNFESMSSIKQRFQLDYDAPEWEQIEFLKDMKDASIITANFLLKVIQEPSLSCVVANESTKEVFAIVPLESISEDQIACEKVKLKEGFKVVGSIGKLVNSEKDPDSENPYMDQIDVRGIWISKVAAIKTLLDRKIDNGSWDKTDDNFLDLPQMRNKVLTVLANVVKGSFREVRSVSLANGQQLEVPFENDLIESHIIANPLSTYVKERLNMPDHNVRLQELLIANVKRANAEKRFGDVSIDEAIKDAFSVQKLSSINKISKVDGEGNQIGLAILAKDDLQYVATPRNLIAHEFIESARVVRELSEFDKAEVELAFNKILSGEQSKPKKATPVEKAVAQFDPKLVQKFLSDEIKPNDYLFSILDILAQ